jgi:flagellar FliJ protein
MSWAESLVRLCAYEVEVLRKRLAEVETRQSANAALLQALDMEEALEAAHASSDAQAGWYLAGFREGLAQRRSAAISMRTTLAAEAQGCLDALQERYEAGKKYELVVKADALTRARTEAAREGAALDAAALRAASRQGRAA